MNLDVMSVVTALAAFGFFMAVHLLWARRGSRDSVLISLRMSLWMAVCADGVAVMRYAAVQNSGWRDTVLMLVVSESILTLLNFLYILCIFGPYESSIRIRLLREIYASYPQGLSEEQLLARYNSAVIVDRRLKRLIKSGDIVFDGQYYSLKKSFSFFFFKEYVTRFLRSLIWRKDEPSR